MKIETEALELKLHRPFTIARESREVARNVLVRVSHDGIVGLGEAAPSIRYGQSQASALAALASFVPPPAATPFELAAIVNAFTASFPSEGFARCGLEMALWDWIGKSQRRPLCRLMAIDPQDFPPSSFTISIDAADMIEERVREAEAWPILKFKMGGGEADRVAIERLRTITDKPFRVDANESWSEDEALEKIEWLAERGCELVEQPLSAGSLEAMARLKEHSPLPLIADEDAQDASSIPDLAPAFHGVNVKLMKTGGIGDAVTMIHAAHQAQLEVMLGCFVESSLGIAAAAHLAPMARWADLDGAALLEDDPFEGTGVRNGIVSLDPGPGLGVRRRS